MDTEIKQQIAGRISVLPQVLQEIIFTSPWKTTTDSISTRYNLTDEQKNQLQNEVFMVLAGIEPISAFRTNLVEEVGVSYDQALKISLELNTNIFDRIKDVLKSIESEIKQVDEEEEYVENNSPARNILEAQFNQNTENIHSEPEVEPELLIPDHEEMEKEGGMHLHTQNTMPVNPGNSAPRPQPQPVKIYSHPQQEFNPQPKPVANPVPTPAPKPSLGSIVDQKLSGIVRSNNDGSKYKGNDPYREPIE